MGAIPVVIVFQNQSTKMKHLLSLAPFCAGGLLAFRFVLGAFLSPAAFLAALPPLLAATGTGELLPFTVTSSLNDKNFWIVQNIQKFNILRFK